MWPKVAPIRRPIKKSAAQLVEQCVLVTAVTSILVLINGCPKNAALLANMQIAPAAVSVGSPLAWRVLDKRKYSNGLYGLWSKPGTLGSIFAGNFDNDTDKELLLLGLAAGRFYDADGTQHPVALHGAQFLLQSGAWDMDRDGIDEIVCEPITEQVTLSRGKSGLPLPTDTPIYSLNGKRITRLPGKPTLGQLIGDYDGDGEPELILSSGTAVVMGENGQQVDSFSLPNGIMFGSLADVDGDGCSEYCGLENKLSVLGIYGYKQARTQAANWPHMYMPTSHADLNGDGCEELLCGLKGYFDPVQSSAVSFSIPASYAGNSTLSESCVAGDFDGDAVLEIAVRVGDVPFSSGLMLFKPDGKCTYYEEFGDVLWGLVCFSSGGQDFIVCQLTDRLLIYP